jgi:hypothetical protein
MISLNAPVNTGQLIYLAAFVVCAPYVNAYGQNQLDRQRQKQIREAPLDQISEVARAQAAVLVAEGEKKVQEALAMKELAAIGNEFTEKLQEVEVDMKVFRWYWQKKAERKAEDRRAVEKLIENRQLVEIERRAVLVQQYDSIFKPERMQIAKLKGTPQNLMLALINEKTDISYSYSIPSSIAKKDSKQFELSDDVIDAIRVSSPTLSGKRMTFSLTDPIAIDLTWWPTLLRHEDFAVERGQINQMRQQLADTVTKDTGLDPAITDSLEKSLITMSTKFYRKYPPGQRGGNTNRQLHLIFQSEDFLRRVDQELSAVVLNGSASPIHHKPFNRMVDGENVGALVRWMLTNNLRFERPTPTNAGQYAVLFEAMKAFCVACELDISFEWIEEASKDLDLEVD